MIKDRYILKLQWPTNRKSYIWSIERSPNPVLRVTPLHHSLTPNISQTAEDTAISCYIQLYFTKHATKKPYTQAFEWYTIQMTLSDLAKNSMTRNTRGFSATAELLAPTGAVNYAHTFIFYCYSVTSAPSPGQIYKRSGKHIVLITTHPEGRASTGGDR